MAYIRHIPPSRACGRLAQVYREIRAEVPRVPNLLQVFSLRAETMEGMYRGWLATMYAGRVARTTRELVALTVSKAAKCQYCVDSHQIFVQASGVDRNKSYEVERRLFDAEGLSEAERVTLRFAARLTSDPRSVTDLEVAELAEVWRDPEERAQVIAVVAGHNVIVRIANALGVALEIPSTLRRFEAGRRGAITLLARLTALSSEMGERPLVARTPEENRQAFEQLFRAQLGFSELPPGYRLLELCPEVFDAQLRIIERSVAVVPRDRWMRIGVVVSRLTNCGYFAHHCGDWLTQRGTDPAEVIAASEGAGSRLPEAEECCLRFTRDLTLHSHTIVEERIDELRAKGLSDGAILDLAYVGAVFNGVVRYVRVLAALERLSLEEQAPVEQKATA